MRAYIYIEKVNSNVYNRCLSEPVTNWNKTWHLKDDY